MRRPTPSRRAALALLLTAAAVNAYPRHDPQTGQILKSSDYVADTDPADDALREDTSDERIMQVPIACLHKDFMMEATNLTLDDIAAISTSPACRRDVVDGAKLLSRLRNRLAALQHTTTCREHALSTTEVFNTGFGGTMHSLIKPLMYKFSHNLTMLTPVLAGWTGSDCGWTMACFFQTLAPACEGKDPMMVAHHRRRIHTKVLVKLKVWGTSFTGEDAFADTVYQKQLEHTMKTSPDTHNFVNQNMSYLWHGDSVIPAEIRPMGWFRYMTQLQQFLWRPSSRLQAKLDDAMQLTGLADALSDGYVIGMHVRHGDACGDNPLYRGRACMPLSSFMKYAEQMREQSGVSTIYLATDSNYILHETSKYPEWTFLHWPESMSIKQKLRTAWNLTTLHWDWLFHQNIATQHWDYNREIADTSIIEMMMLSKAHLFIGQATSNFYRTAIELKSASCDCIPAFYSLDSPWCFDFAVKAGKNVYNNDTASNNKWLC